MTAQTFILPNQRAEMLAHIERIPMARKWRVEIALYRKRRSDAQNKYLWGVAYKALKDATGQSADDWHEYFLGEHFGWETVEMFGKKKLRPLNRSSKLTTMEFMDFVDFIQMRAAEYNVYIPDPNEGDL